jgi:hypothetical protein
MMLLPEGRRQAAAGANADVSMLPLRRQLAMLLHSIALNTINVVYSCTIYQTKKDLMR